MNFDDSFTQLIGNEGSYTADPEDDGNWTGGKYGKGDLKGTKFGISAAEYPNEDIENLTLEQAKAIYLRDYWQRCAIDSLPEALKFPIFDMAVNTGQAYAVMALQYAVGEKQDGRIGPLTLAAIAAFPPDKLVGRVNGGRLMQLTMNLKWPQFGRGWVARVARELMSM